MKSVYLVTLFLVLCSLSIVAQKKDEQAVAVAVSQLNQAMIDGNLITLDQLASEQLSYGHSSGAVETKDAFITAIVDGVSGFSAIDLTEQTINIVGNIAIVRHKFSAGTDNKGQSPGTVKLSVMQIWQKHKGKWQLLARQATKI